MFADTDDETVENDKGHFMNNPIRVMIVDDHELVRDGLAAVLAGQPDLQLVASAASGAEALSAYANVQPDVVLLDVLMPDIGGLGTLSNLLTAHPRARVVMLSSHQGDHAIYKSLCMGAVGYVLKGAPIEDLLAAIRRSVKGNVQPSDAVAEQLAKRAFLPDLSEREVKVLEQVAQGFSNKEIAEHLGVSAGTVKVHVTHILAKLDAADRTQAVTIALQRGIVALDR